MSGRRPASTAHSVAERIFIRAWLTTTPRLPDADRAAAQAVGAERYATFLDTLGRRLTSGASLVDQVFGEVPQRGAPKTPAAPEGGGS